MSGGKPDRARGGSIREMKTLFQLVPLVAVVVNTA
jgi:hypothetical protein